MKEGWKGRLDGKLDDDNRQWMLRVMGDDGEGRKRRGEERRGEGRGDEWNMVAWIKNKKR